MLAVENAKVNGAELLKKLAETGTGKDKLALANNVLAFVYKKFGRVATANEVLDALEQNGAPEFTLHKAKCIAETGGWTPAVADGEVPLYEQLLAGGPVKLPAEEPEKSLVEQAQEAAAEVGTDLHLPGVKKTEPKGKKPAAE